LNGAGGTPAPADAAAYTPAQMLTAFFTRPDGSVRAPWRLLFFFLATTCASLLIAGVMYPVIEATPIVAIARRISLPLDQIAAILALHVCVAAHHRR
jgi:hypothetical protein